MVGPADPWGVDLTADASQKAPGAGCGSAGMSRLDSFIRRLEAQRACLDHAARLVADVPGVVVELGLGNGRTFDHLRERVGAREIFVFERQPDPHPLCAPDAAHLILGDLADTLPAADRRLPGKAALAHSDVGSGDVAASAEVAALVGRHLPRLLTPGAIVVSDQPLASDLLAPLALPPGVTLERYFMYRRIA
jgi:hypothetical protein